MAGLLRTKRRDQPRRVRNDAYLRPCRGLCNEAAECGQEIGMQAGFRFVQSGSPIATMV